MYFYTKMSLLTIYLSITYIIIYTYYLFITIIYYYLLTISDIWLVPLWQNIETRTIHQKNTLQMKTAPSQHFSPTFGT